MQQLDRAGWVGPFASKLTTATQRDMVTDAVHAVQIPTSSPGSTDGIEPGRIFLPILHAGYAYYPLAISASATRRPISLFAARELSTASARATVHDFLGCAVLARDAGYDRVEIMGSESYLINQFLMARTNQRNTTTTATALRTECGWTWRTCETRGRRATRTIP